MYTTENFVKYLNESKDDLEENVIQTSTFIYRNELLNVIYEVHNGGKKPLLQIVHIGAPAQIITMLNHSVSVPLRQVEIDLLETPALKRVYTEKKPIYFKKLPELVQSLLPNIKQRYMVSKGLQQLGITDVAVIPIVLEKQKKEYILAVLGPLDNDQKAFIKEVAKKFTNHHQA